MTDIEEMCPNCGSMTEQVYNTANDFYSCQLCGASYDDEKMELPNGDEEYIDSVKEHIEQRKNNS